MQKRTMSKGMQEPRWLWCDPRVVMFDCELSTAINQVQEDAHVAYGFQLFCLTQLTDHDGMSL